MRPRTLTVRQLAHLRQLGDGVRNPAGERVSSVRMAVEAVLVYRDGGTGLDELAKALGVQPLVLRQWMDEQIPKSQRIDIVGASGVTRPIPPGAGVLACTGDPRPGRNDFIRELAAIRGHVKARFAFVEQVAIEIAELGPAIEEHEPAVLHVAAHSADGSVFFTRSGLPVPILPTQVAAAVLAGAHRPRILILNFCCSIVLAPDLKDLVRAMICWPSIATDDQCYEFADLLYRDLGNGRTITACMDAVRITLPRFGIPPSNLPRLIGDGTTRLA